MISNGFANKAWNTTIVLAATAAVCVCVTNLAPRFESAQSADFAFVELSQSDSLFSPVFTNGYEALRF